MQAPETLDDNPVILKQFIGRLQSDCEALRGRIDDMEEAMDVNQQEKNMYAVIIQELRDEIDKHDIQECVKRYEIQEKELQD